MPRLTDYISVALAVLSALGLIVVLGAIWAAQPPETDTGSDDAEDGEDADSHRAS
jgi:hypothetical protein